MNTSSGRRSFIEIPPDKLDQSIDGRPGIGSVSPKMHGRSFTQLEAHDPDDAFRIDPVGHAVAAEVDLRFETLGKLSELHRRSCVKPDLMGDDGGTFRGMVQYHDLLLVLTLAAITPLRWRGP